MQGKNATRYCQAHSIWHEATEAAIETADCLEGKYNIGKGAKEGGGGRVGSIDISINLARMRLMCVDVPALR